MKSIPCAWAATASAWLLLTGSAFAETIRWAQYDASPYAAEHLPSGGFWCRLVQEAVVLHGHEVSIRWYPLKRAFSMVEQGQADLSLRWLKTPERQQTVTFSDQPVASSPVALFHRQGAAFDWERLEDLSGLRIGDRLGNVNGSQAYLAARPPAPPRRPCSIV